MKELSAAAKPSAAWASGSVSWKKPTRGYTKVTQIAATDEEPVIPDYNYTEVSATIVALDEKIAIIKHALNLTNASAKIMVGDTEMSVDTM